MTGGWDPEQGIRSLIENDYMNAEVVRFDGGIRFQPK